jgi:cholestenol Delta-isomerase
MFGSATSSTLRSETPHPFYPVGIELAGYLANDKDTGTLLGIALAGVVVICSATWTVLSKISQRVRTVDRLAILWFMSSKAFLHAICNPPC